MIDTPFSGRRRPGVVIVGAGFAGLYTARALADAPVDVTVIDRRNHHLFQPLLYQVATAALNPSEISAPIRRVLRKQGNATVLLGEALSVDTGGKRVILTDAEIPYDYLVVATGVSHSYFGNDGWARWAPGLKTLEDALDIRRRVLLAFEAAEREDDPARRRQWLTFVIVGGGPTGVELAGAFAEISRHSLAGDFRRVDSSQAGVILLEGLARILPTFEEQLSEKAARQLAKRGVIVRTGARVTAVDPAGVWLGDENIPARTVIWAAGVVASPLGQSLGVELDPTGRVLVTPELSLPTHPEVFVIGDLAHVESRGIQVPGVAPAAIQEGRHTARSIRRALEGRSPAPFRYRDKGMLATVGRADAVGSLPHIKISGILAWLVWLGIHIYFLIGFRNRLLVMVQWIWSYLTWERGARLITGPVGPLLERPAEEPSDPARSGG